MNQEKQILTNKIDELEQKTKTYEKDLYVKDVKTKDFSDTVNLVYKQKEEALEISSKCQKIISNWSNSHHNLTKLINNQIPDQCAKIIGGDLDGALEISEEDDYRPNFYDKDEPINDYSTRFVSNSYIDQTLIDT